MIIYIQSFISTLIAMFCCKIFSEAFGEKKNGRKRLINVGSFVLLVVLEYCAAVLLDNYFVMKQIFVIFSTAVWIAFYLKIKIGNAFILSALFQQIVLVSDYLALLAARNLNEEQLGEILYNSLLLAMSELFLLCFVLAVRWVVKRNTVIMIKEEWLRFLFFPTLTVSVVSIMLNEAGSVENLMQWNLLGFISFGLVAMNIYTVYLVWDIVRREKEVREEQLFKQQVKNQTEMYRSISENLERQRKKAHEYNNQTHCIQSLLAKKQYDKLEEYVGGLGGKPDGEEDFFDTGNVIVDAVLNTKYSECRKKGIILTCRLGNLSAVKISDEDMVVILSNLLNNAEEACEKCGGERIIRLKFMPEDENVILSVTNTCESAVVYKDGKIQTTKQQNPEEHGIGLKNVEAAVKRYGGSCASSNQEGEFCFTIRIPL